MRLQQRQRLLLVVCLLIVDSAWAQLSDAFAPFQTLLNQHLTEYHLPDNGLASAFDYRAARQDPATRDLLADQDKRLAAFNTKTLTGKADSTAFWINAYNYFMISHIVREPSDDELVSSVKDFGPFYNPYRVFRQEMFTIGGKLYSLDKIEKGTLLGSEFTRKGWKDARIHFAVNCASVGCPPLRQQLYTAENLDDMLNDNTFRALATPLHLRLTDRTLYLTQLFDWYEDDFVSAAGSVKRFVLKYAPKNLQDQIQAASSIDFIDYDWQLNTPDNFSTFHRYATEQ